MGATWEKIRCIDGQEKVSERLQQDKHPLWEPMPLNRLVTPSGTTRHREMNASHRENGDGSPTARSTSRHNRWRAQPTLDTQEASGTRQQKGTRMIDE